MENETTMGLQGPANEANLNDVPMMAGTESTVGYYNGRYCIVRTYSAGVFAGVIHSEKNKEVVIKKARRIWYWDGAASLSQLAMKGTSKPKNCKFPCEMDEVKVTEAIEIIPCTEKAMKSIKEVPVWEN